MDAAKLHNALHRTFCGMSSRITGTLPTLVWSSTRKPAANDTCWRRKTFRPAARPSTIPLPSSPLPLGTELGAVVLVVAQAFSLALSQLSVSERVAAAAADISITATHRV